MTFGIMIHINQLLLGFVFGVESTAFDLASKLPEGNNSY